MTPEDVEKLCLKYKTQELVFQGPCHDCRKDIEVTVSVGDDGKLSVQGGAVWKPWESETFFTKCDTCLQANPMLSDFQPVTAYSRVVGYLTPVEQYNPGKKAEFHQRVTYAVGNNFE